MRLRFLDAAEQQQAGPAVEAEAGGEDDVLGLVAALEAAPDDAPVTAADIVEAALHFHGAPSSLVSRLLDRRRRHEDPTKLLAAGLRAAMRFSALPRGRNLRLMLMGPPAAGKSTLVAKLAAEEGAPPATVLSTDTERPGGMQQLAEFLAVLGLEAHPISPFGVHAAGVAGDPGRLLIDTAGIDATDAAGVAELGGLAAAARAEPVLVIAATMDGNEARDLAEAALAIGARRAIVTRLDMARRLGAVLAVGDAGLALAGASVTPHFSFGFKYLTPLALAEHLLDLAALPAHQPGQPGAGRPR